MRKTMQCRGFKISERNDGTFKIKYKDGSEYYETICDTFLDAGQWVWNMANNNDEARLVNHKMCDVFKRKFFVD